MSNSLPPNKALKAKMLFVHYGDDWLRGSEIVLLDLLKSAKADNYTPVLWCNSDALAKAAKNLDVEVIKDNFVCLGYWTLPRWNFVQFFKLLIKAKKLIKQHKISLVHCNNGAPCQWMVPVCKYTSTPLLLHLHARYMYRDRLTLMFHGADSIIGVSQSVTQIFKRNEFRNQHVDVIYNGIDQKRVLCPKPRDLRAELSASKDDFVILYMGSLISRKLVDVLLYAVDRLGKNYRIKLAIVGSGSEAAKLVCLVNQLNLNRCVKFISATEQVAEIYASNADCFISVPSEEVFGLTLAEASLAKLPIITSNIVGISEIYNHQENALLVSPNNTDELVNAIKSLIEIPSLRQKLADNAQQHIAKSFTLKQQFIAFNLAYQSLLHHKIQRNVMATIFLFVKTLFIAFFNKGCKFMTMNFSWGKSHD